MNKSLISIAIALALTAGTAHAERAAHRHSFTADKTRTTDKGTYTRHTEQDVTDSGFTRSTLKTNPAGETATRDRAVVKDSSTGTRTGTVSGTTFNGKAYSGESVRQKTDTGYTSNGSFTGPNGKTSTRSAVATVDKENGTFSKDATMTGPNGGTTTRSVDAALDKENGTMTKNISVTTPSGEVHNTTVVKSISKADASAE